MKLAFLGDMAFIGKYDSATMGLESCANRFEALRDVLGGCDHVIGNLEAPLTGRLRTNEAKTLPLRSDPANVGLLGALGVDFVSLANNHAFDYGEAGLRDTVALLEDNHIGYFGVDGRSCLLSEGGDSVELFGMCCKTTNAWHYDDLDSPGPLCTLRLANVREAFARAGSHSALPVLCCHWGEENTHYPRKEHLDIARSVCAGGDCLIVGHHPHVVQGYERLGSSAVAYSLGNFCFDDCPSDSSTGVSVRQTDDNKQGGILLAEVSGSKLTDFRVLGIRDDGERVMVDEQVTETIERLSSDLGHVEDWDAYQAKRLEEMADAAALRLGKRDLRWLVGHLNSKAFRAVAQRKSNQRSFSSIVGEFRASN